MSDDVNNKTELFWTWYSDENRFQIEKINNKIKIICIQNMYDGQEIKPITYEYDDDIIFVIIDNNQNISYDVDIDKMQY